MANLSDVAQLAGVSISAVSRVLSGASSARVSDSTRERIEAAARELDYRPNFAGRALRSSRSNAIALIVPDLTNAVFAELMRGAEAEALARDYMVLLGRAESMQPGGESIRRLIGEGRVDAVLVQLSDAVQDADRQALLESRAPVVFINSVEKGHVGSVVLDDEEAVRIAVAHLVDLGHQRIGLLNGLPTASTAKRRAAGFRLGMADAGLPVREEYVEQLGYEPTNGREGLRRLMALETPPTAVVISNVNAAIGALAEARTLGIKIPEQLSCVAIHDSWTAENSWPPLTTVRMPLYELGRMALTMAVDRLGTGVVDDLVVTDPPPLLMVRESTAPHH